MAQPLSRRPGGGAAAVALTLLAAAALLPTAAAVKGISDWSPGIITHFGGEQRGAVGRWVAVSPPPPD